MTTADTQQVVAQRSPWNRLPVLLLIAGYVIAHAFAFRIYSEAKYAEEWDAISTDMVWTTIASTFVLGGIVAAIATAWDARWARPLQPVGVFNYSLFLYVSVMLACQSLVIVLDWVKAHENELSLSVRGAIALLGLVLVAALVHLVTRKPLTLAAASNVGIIAVASTTAAMMLAL